MVDSYTELDAAEWVRSNIGYSKPGTWGKNLPTEFNPFQATVLNILGIVGRGIYNAPILWPKTEWASWYVLIVWGEGHELATADGWALTRLVYLCHETRIRCSVQPCSSSTLQFLFHDRENCPGGSSARHHDNMDEMLARFRKSIPADSLVFQGRVAPALTTEGEAA
jgi:hypothetical protein